MTAGAQRSWLGAWWMAGMLLVSSPLAAAEEPLGDMLSAAKEALAASDFRSAETIYRRALLTDPSSVEAMVGWSRALGAQGRGHEALPSLRRRAEEATSRDDLEAAARLLEVAVEIQGEKTAEGKRARADLRSRLGQVLALDRRYLSAERELLSAWRSGQKDPATALFLANTLWENGKLDQAEARLRDAVALGAPGDQAASAHHQLGRFLLWGSRYAEAVDELDKAIRSGAHGLDFELDRAHALAGAVAEGAARPEQVIDAFRSLVERAPEHSQLRYGLARALLAAGRRDEAREQLAEFRKLVAEDEENARRLGVERARFAEVSLLLAQDRIAEALARLDSMPPVVETLRLRALALRRAGRGEEAREVLREAIVLEPERQDLRTLLVELEREAG